MIQKAENVTLKVLPVLATAEHLYYYEGPCRFGSGEALQPGYDRLANAQKVQQFLGKVRECAEDAGKIELMEPVFLERTDDWDNHEAMWEAAAGPARECDFAVCMQGIACDDSSWSSASGSESPLPPPPSPASPAPSPSPP